jgi:hypothetical protein
MVWKGAAGEAPFQGISFFLLLLFFLSLVKERKKRRLGCIQLAI